MDRDRETRVRLAALERVRQLTDEYQGGAIPSRDLAQRISLGGESIAIFNHNVGIHRPRQLDAAIQVLTSPGNPYQDAFDEAGAEGLLRYSYRLPNKPTVAAQNAADRDNHSVRQALEYGLPLIYYLGLEKGRYLAFAPVHVIGDDRMAREFQLDLTGITAYESPAEAEVAKIIRRHEMRHVKVRLHQAKFRERVMKAYAQSCAMCSLKHVRLLDAAHIVEDSDGGEPEVTNGISLCKIHHAAFDQLVIGIEPGSHLIHVNREVMLEVDGPMLRYGIQEMNGNPLILPRAHQDRPAQGGLEARWERFRAA